MSFLLYTAGMLSAVAVEPPAVCQNIDQNIIDAFVDQIRRDIEPWTHQTYTVSELKDAIKYETSQNPYYGATLLRLDPKGSVTLLSGWGVDSIVSWIIHQVERFVQFTGLAAGRPDALKTLRLRPPTGFSRPVHVIINDREWDQPLTSPGNLSECARRIGAKDLASLRVPTGTAPVLSVSRVDGCSRDILIPWRNLFEPPSSIHAVNGPNLAVAVWRGKKNCYELWNGEPCPRESLYTWSKRLPADWTNVQWSANNKLTPSEQISGGILLDADGFSYSKRLAWYWQQDSAAVVKTGRYTDVLLRQSIAGTHYLRFDTESELRETIFKLRKNETYRKTLATAGAKFGRRFLRPVVWECYLHLVIHLYADMVHVV